MSGNVLLSGEPCSFRAEGRQQPDVIIAYARRSTFATRSEQPRFSRWRIFANYDATATYAFLSPNFVATCTGFLSDSNVTAYDSAYNVLRSTG